VVWVESSRSSQSEGENDLIPLAEGYGAFYRSGCDKITMN
jgi:hypothetical protein